MNVCVSSWLEKPCINAGHLQFNISHRGDTTSAKQKAVIKSIIYKTYTYSKCPNITLSELKGVREIQ